MNRQELRKLIPQGYCKVIAAKAGVTQKSVSHFMNGKSNSHRIEIATLEVLADLKREKNNLLKKIK
jgi:transcriptional regulator with XRE-family HTH domain